MTRVRGPGCGGPSERGCGGARMRGCRDAVPYPADAGPARTAAMRAMRESGRVGTAVEYSPEARVAHALRELPHLAHPRTAPQATAPTATTAPPHPRTSLSIPPQPLQHPRVRRRRVVELRRLDHLRHARQPLVGHDPPERRLARASPSAISSCRSRCEANGVFESLRCITRSAVAAERVVEPRHHAVVVVHEVVAGREHVAGVDADADAVAVLRVDALDDRRQLLERRAERRARAGRRLEAEDRRARRTAPAPR